MSGTIPPLPQYDFTAWCPVKKAQGNFALSFTFYQYHGNILLGVVYLSFVNKRKALFNLKLIYYRQSSGLGK
jgi:hypothetical protein